MTKSGIASAKWRRDVELWVREHQGGQMPKVHIPQSVEELTANLDGINRLLTAKQWERAAIVYAWTDPGSGGPRTGGKSHQLSSREFADLGITGLRDPKQVRAYRAAWESAADDGQASLDIKPGDDVILPTLPWKEHFGEQSSDVQERVFRQVLRAGPGAVASAIGDDVGLYNEIASAALTFEPSRRIVEASVAPSAPRIEPRVAEEWTPPERDHRTDLVRGVNLLIPVLRAMQRGEWQPSASEELLIHSLGLLLSQSSADEQEDLFAEIDSYLKERVS